MKKKRNYRRFNTLSVWAVLACLIMFLFQGFFVFELYRLEPEQIPAILRPAAALWIREEKTPMQQEETESVSEEADEPPDTAPDEPAEQSLKPAG